MSPWPSPSTNHPWRKEVSFLRANDVSLYFSLTDSQDSDECQTKVENESKTLNSVHFDNQNTERYSTIIVEENEDTKEINEHYFKSEDNDVVNSEKVTDVYSFYETGQECDSQMFNTTITERK